MAEQRLSETLDSYFDRSRKTISQWVNAHVRSELTKVNGNITVPVKKPLQDIFDYVMLDPHLNSVVQQRKSKVTGEEFAIFTNNVIDEELTAQLSKQWFSKIQDSIIDSKVYGYNLIEIQELVDNQIKDVKIIGRGNVIPEMRSIVKNPLQVSINSLIPIDNRNDSAYYILVDSGDLGFLNKVVPLVMMKRLTLSNWAFHAEVFGIPPIILKTDNQDQINKFHEDLTKFVHSRKIVISNSDSLEVLDSSSTDAHKIYKELIETCNAEISKSVIGQTSTTDVKAYVGSAEVHERVAAEIAESDREFVSYVMNDIVFPKLIALGYKLENASFKYVSKEKRSYQEKLDTVKVLKETGYFADADAVKLYLDLPFDLEALEPSETAIDNAFKKKART